MRAVEFMRALADVIEKLDGDDTSPTQEKQLNPVMLYPVQQSAAPVKTAPPKNPEEKDPNPVMITPLQQEVELAKSAAGKDSPIIKKLTQDETEHNPANPIFKTR